LPLASKLIATGVVAVTPVAGLLATVVALLPVTVIELPLEQVLGLLHWTAQFTVLAPVSAAVQAPVLVSVLMARST
jgi:hypothetical protein